MTCEGDIFSYVATIFYMTFQKYQFISLNHYKS